MCDQTEVSYLEDNVVWVKIGPIWWPGVVKDLEKDDEGREILAGLKKKPIAVVKFFQEDNYEFVKNLDHIYHYSCRRKDEFIKKGLDKFRSGAPHMKKFPADVTTAESLVNGDINIINDPKFYPEKKESYSEIFGSGKKKSKKDTDITSKSKNRASANVTPYRTITHQRFINKVLHGESDHRVKTLIQTNSSLEDGVARNPYKCHICKFETSRVNVIVAHHRLSHSPNSVNWTSDSKIVVRKPVYRPRKIKSKKLFDTSKDDHIEEEVPDKKKSPKSKSSKEKTKNVEKFKSEDASVSPSKRKRIKEELPDSADSKKTRFTDVLLADWNEEDDEEKKDEKKEDDEEDEEEEKKNKNNEEEEKRDDEGEESTVKNSEEDTENKNETPSGSSDPVNNSDSSTPTKNQSGKMSCFDFDEEEEGFIGMSNANTYGRKIPRVIPVKDKSELGLDMEIEELFKRKNEESDSANEETANNEEKKKIEEITKMETTETVESDKDKKEKEKPVTPAKPEKRRRSSKSEKKEDTKGTPEDSLALRRTRRPGAKKSYLNEVIEKIEDEEVKPELAEKKIEQESNEMILDVIAPKPEVTKPVKEETISASSSSSRRKQDFKHQTIDSEREEMVYSDIVNSEQKSKPADNAEKRKTKSSKIKDLKRGGSDDLTAQIDSLLEETKLPSLPEVGETANEKVENTGKMEESKSANTTNFSFDYLPAEQVGKKSGKNRTDVKSISRMFSDSIPNPENESEPTGDTQPANQTEEWKDIEDDSMTIQDGSQGKTITIANLKFSQSANSSQKRGSVVLSSLPPKTCEGSAGQVKVVPMVRQASTSKDCILLPTGKKFDLKNSGITTEEIEQNPSESESSQRPKNIKTIKVKPDSLITAGKLKSQTILHQKGGKYVIVTQPPHLGRQRATSRKVQSGSKVVILTNQLGEQKILTTSGLQQTKFKVDGTKIVGTTDLATDKEGSSSCTLGQSQPVIKMVPDGKGGIMKQLTVSPKKVLLGGTKVLVSGSGTTFSSGNSVQKITLPGGSSGTRSGDYRLIENYKGSGKTVLIQGGSNSSSGVVIKPSSVVPRQITKLIQSPQTISTLKKKPKILMRASTGQGEYVMQSASGSIESPTFVVKQKGADGKFSTQKIVRTGIVNQPKASSGTKAFFFSGQGSGKKGESYIIQTNEAAASKVIRMRPKIKEVDVSPQKSSQKIIHKTPELYTISQNSLLLPNQTQASDNETQIVQIQEQSQQPVLQTQVIAMPGPVGADGNQTYVIVSVDENGVVQSMDNSVVAYDATAQQDPIFANSTSTNNVLLINPQSNEETTTVFSTSSQDILAEALANTNVLEGSITSEIDSVVPSILLPPSIPSSVVQETSITLQKPIMTPLEMPSSVTPDTSGLEPPPLPPTPTEEDVLMEESEIPQKERELTSNDTLQTYLQPENFDTVSTDPESSFQVTDDFSKENENQKIFEGQFETRAKAEENCQADRKENEFFQEDENRTQDGEEECKDIPREEFIIENSQEEQSTNSFQSMPLLNDEPDTSDDAQGSEPIGDQQFETQKSRLESEQFSQLLREQEPPSSTNNEIITENNVKKDEREFQTSKYEYNHQTYESENGENQTKSKEQGEEKTAEEDANGGKKDKEAITLIGTKDSQSLPIIADDSNINTYEIDPVYSDVISQKRFQEETEVSSTTDEYANKEVTN